MLHASFLTIDLKLDSRITYSPDRIISIVGSSRSGSSLFKHALCLHPDLCCLAGEEEPYFKLACNGYPWHSHDEFHVLDNQDIIRSLIANELCNHESVNNRRLLQEYQIEVEPFVEPIECRPTDTLVLKTPQNIHRRGILESLYPDAEIVYLVMERDPRAIVNGLMDGWASGKFRARETLKGWWCFNMAPNWSWDSSLLGRCTNQWQQSYLYDQRDYAVCLRITFEHVEHNWLDVCRDVWDYLNLRRYSPPAGLEMPELVCTDKPQPERWKLKRPWLADLPELVGYHYPSREQQGSGI